MSAATPASPSVQGSTSSTNLRRFLKRNAWVLALSALLLAMLVFTKIIQPDYGARAFTILVVAALPFAFATAGQTMAIIAGGIDLSIAAMMAFISVAAASLMQGQSAEFGIVAVGLILLMGLGVGAVNGLAVVLTRVPDIVVTLSFFFIWEGAALMVLDSPGGATTQWLRDLLTGTMGASFLPSDVTGVSVWDREQGSFTFRAGPVFTNVLLGDEINRASPKTQAALLEAMEERQITVDGQTRVLEAPFIVIATQNPIEHEGTYPLPEAQLDRFMMRVTMGYPERAKELEMLDTHGIRSSFDDLKPVIHAEDIVRMTSIAAQIHVADVLKHYLVDVAEATRSHPDILLGASPRATLFLQRAARSIAAAAGRDYASPDDVKLVLDPVLNHRLIIRPEAQMRGVTTGSVIEEVMASVPVPGTKAVG